MLRLPAIAAATALRDGDRLGGACLRIVVFLALSHWLDTAWFRAVQWSGLVPHQDVHSPTVRLVPYLSFKIGPVVVAVVLSALLARYDRRSLAWCGIPMNALAARRFGQGAAVAITSFSLLMAMIWVLGGYSISGWAQHGTAALGYAIGWGVLFGMVALQEELTFRGYALRTLGKPAGFWPAAVVTSLYFGTSHAGNAFEDWQSELMLALFALSGCWVRWLTGSLWFPIGFHMLWDYTESIVFSVPDSGLVSVGRLLDAGVTGPPALTGGPVGPEASPAALLVDVLVLAAVTVAFWRRRPSSATA